MVVYLESNALLSGNQHGFRKGRSCLKQLLQHYDEILRNMNAGYETDVIYLDYAKAFNKVDHKLLIFAEIKSLWYYRPTLPID